MTEGGENAGESNVGRVRRKRIPRKNRDTYSKLKLDEEADNYPEITEPIYDFRNMLMSNDECVLFSASDTF